MKIYTLIIAMLFILPIGIINAKSVGESAPDFTLTADDGSTFKLSDQAGKVVFVFLFGNSCPTCIANGPNTESALYQELKSHANFVAVGVDVWDGSAASVQSFKASTGITYPLLLKGGSLTSLYATQHDRVMVIDQNGIIRYKSSSQASASAVAQAKTIIEDLLQTANLQAEDVVDEFSVYLDRSANQLVFNKPFVHESASLVRVMDMSGRIVYQADMHLEHENRIAFNASSRGVYFISVSNESGSYLQRILY